MSHPAFETLLYSLEDGIATVTLNRPEKMNAFTAQMRDDLVAAFDRTDADDDAPVSITLTRRELIHREASGGLCQQAVDRHAGLLSVVGRTGIRVKAAARG
jgi:1,4-dihydroxy-2-naphthoyl-CoA synthase